MNIYFSTSFESFGFWYSHITQINTSYIALRFTSRNILRIDLSSWLALCYHIILTQYARDILKNNSFCSLTISWDTVRVPPKNWSTNHTSLREVCRLCEAIFDPLPLRFTLNFINVLLTATRRKIVWVTDRWMPYLSFCKQSIIVFRISFVKYFSYFFIIVILHRIHILCLI